MTGWLVGWYVNINQENPQLKQPRGQKGKLSPPPRAQKEEERPPPLAWQEVGQRETVTLSQ